MTSPEQRTARDHLVRRVRTVMRDEGISEDEIAQVAPTVATFEGLVNALCRQRGVRPIYPEITRLRG